MIFSEIENAVLKNDFDCGLVIHESRFTYAQKGLYQLMDMGEWWEKSTGVAIPLGGICIKNNIEKDKAQFINQLIRQSLEYSWRQYPKLSPFITCNAQEMQESVMRQHIELYVNDYTLSLGIEGRRAIDTLFQKAATIGWGNNKLPNYI